MKWLSELDWSPRASLLSARLYPDHWRLVVCQLAGAFVAFVVWDRCFPHVFGFTKVWCAGVTSLTFGFLIPGAIWQIFEKKRRVATNGRLMAFMCVSGLPLLVLLWLAFVPEFAAQEKQRSMLRSLDVKSIASITVSSRGVVHRVHDAGALGAFIRSSNGAELFYPSHEGSLRELWITISHKNGSSLEYKARTPERHPQDVTLQFHTHFSLSQIILPGLRPWIDKTIQKRAGSPAIGQRLDKFEGARH